MFTIFRVKQLCLSVGIILMSATATGSQIGVPPIYPSFFGATQSVTALRSTGLATPLGAKQGINHFGSGANPTAHTTGLYHDADGMQKEKIPCKAETNECIARRWNHLLAAKQSSGDAQPSAPERTKTMGEIIKSFHDQYDKTDGFITNPLNPPPEKPKDDKDKH